jgi:uncharacterized protein (TIGR03086 family)
MRDNVEDHRRARATFTQVVGRAQAVNGWDRQSPCPEWDARGVLEHVIGFHDQLILRPLDAKPPRPKDDPVARWKVTDEALAAALTRPEVKKDLIGVLATEVLVHAWDLASAVGEDVALDPELCQVGVERAEANRDKFEASDMFGPFVPVPADASAQDRLLGLFGRDPKWKAD